MPAAGDATALPAAIDVAHLHRDDVRPDRVRAGVPLVVDRAERPSPLDRDHAARHDEIGGGNELPQLGEVVPRVGRDDHDLGVGAAPVRRGVVAPDDEHDRREQQDRDGTHDRDLAGREPASCRHPSRSG